MAPDDAPAREDVHEPEAPEPAVVPGPELPDDEVAAAIVARFEGAVFARSHGQPVVYVDRSVFAEVAGFLRDEQQFTMCVDITATDHLLDGERYAAAELATAGVATERFEVVANFLSHVRNRRVRVICAVPDSDAKVPSLTGVYPGTDFPERETYDMFGIEFEGHPDLTRILMPDDWDGHPLRKDYPSARVPVTFKGDPHPR
jgi:NADH-quinone oxidoreductase subunit C